MQKICIYVKPSDNTDSPDSSDESNSWLWYVITITAILLLIINIFVLKTRFKKYLIELKNVNNRIYFNWKSRRL